VSKKVSKPKHKFPHVDELTLHLANIQYYRGCIAALEHILKTGLDEKNVQLTLRTYRDLLANEDPKAATA
jgi:hypothetical protein